METHQWWSEKKVPEQNVNFVTDKDKMNAISLKTNVWLENQAENEMSQQVRKNELNLLSLSVYGFFLSHSK